MIQLSEYLAMMPLVNSAHLEQAESGIYTLSYGCKGKKTAAEEVGPSRLTRTGR